MSTEAKTDTQTKETKGARTKALIKQTIVELVSKSSPVDVTLADLCEAANVTVGAFYFHFSGKEAALEETACDAIRQYYRHVLDAAEQAITPDILDDHLARIMRAYLSNFTERQAQTRFIRMMVPSNNTVKATWEEERGVLVGHLEQLISSARSLDAENPISYFTTEFLLTATEAFLENLFFGSDTRLKLAAGAPDVVIRNIAAIWERAIMNPNRIGDYL